MPITYRAKGTSAERAYQTALDWTRRIMQLSVLATLLLYAYLFYGLLFGGIGEWGTLGKPEQARIDANVEHAVFYLNLVIGLLLLTTCILYYDEESLGYTLVILSIALYYGVPFLFDSLLTGQLQTWEKTGNTAALSILNQFHVAGLILAVPGGILVVRDLILRIADSSRRNREEFRSMQYGSHVKEEAPTGTVLIGMFAKCWQLSFCREAIRKRCPIYYAKTRCWRERVGCMCEENVIRHAMDSLIHKEIIRKDDVPIVTEESSVTQEESFITKDDPFITKDEAPVGGQGEPGAEKTTEIPQREFMPSVSPKRVRIPHNPNLPMSVKAERCRNCVIYNEHQRLKYQFFAPIFVIAVPALCIWKIDVITGWLNSLLQTVDRVMANLSLQKNPGNAGIASSITSTSAVAQYIVIGCLVVIATTMALRVLEYLVFKWKI